MYKRKKFLGFTLVALSAVILGACSTSSSNSDSNSNSVSTSSETKENAASDSKVDTSKQTFKIGDKITFDNQAEITITGAEWTDERNQFDDTNPERVLKVTYNVVNLSDKDLYVGSDLELYVGGKKMETYPNTNTMETISAGRSLENGVAHFGVSGNGNLELEVKPFAAFGEKAKIVSLDIQ